MAQEKQFRKFTLGELAFFMFLLIVCIAGSIGIFWFAVGIENGNRIIEGFMQSLLRNAAGIVVVLLLFNIILALYYSKKK